MARSFIHIVPPEQAEGRMAKLYGSILDEQGRTVNVYAVHSLRPATLQGHMSLYRGILRHSDLALPLWFREALGTYVSALNGCGYCVHHHASNLRAALDDEARAEEVIHAIESDRPAEALEDKQAAAFAYARKLTLAPAEIVEADVETLRAAGYDDGEILEINQIAAYYAYANRTVLGLGVTAEDEPERGEPHGESQ
ncbi:MAG: peroxidase-related enzyme [Rhodovibrionaceae bacterium]|nr:peroxidase-related enzyme [Rhodovibrionaceae bacterium]